MSWNVRLLTTFNDWSGNKVLDAIMRFGAKDLIFVVFAGLALIGLPYLRRRLRHGGACAGPGMWARGARRPLSRVGPWC